MIGAVTVGWRSSQAMATWAGVTSRRSAISHRAVHDREVRVGEVQLVRELVSSGALRVSPAVASSVAGQEPARQRAPRNDPDAFVLAQLEHFALLLAIDEVVVILHGDEPRPAARVRQVQRLGELPGRHTGRAQVASLPRANDVIERFEGLVDRCVRIPSMDLIEVDVVDAQSAQRGIDRVHHVFSRQPPIVRAVAPSDRRPLWR